MSLYLIQVIQLFIKLSFNVKIGPQASFHVSGKDYLPPNLSDPRGLGFVVKARIDEDYTGDTFTQGSRTGFIIYVNSATVHCISKEQNSCDISTFGSKSVAIIIFCEYIPGLR